MRRPLGERARELMQPPPVWRDSAGVLPATEVTALMGVTSRCSPAEEPCRVQGPQVKGLGSWLGGLGSRIFGGGPWAI